MPPSELSSAAMSLITMSSAPTSTAAILSAAMAPSAPRSKERRRCDLERKLLSDTIKVVGSHMSNSARRRLSKLLKHKSANHASEDAFRKNDIDRRRGVAELMRIRVNAGMEDHRISNEWITIAAVKTEKYAEMEMEHRGWILQELEARVGESSATWILRRDQRNRKAEARLLHDTLTMPGRGGIPLGHDGWLMRCFKKHPENLKTKDDIKAYHQARCYAVDYIAACRRDAGIQGDLEATFTNRGLRFGEIDEELGTKEELESLARAELNKINWEKDSEGDDDDNEDEEDEQDDGGLAVEALDGGEAGEGRVERIPPEPISADEAESEYENERMLPEPVSCGEEDNDEEEEE